MESVKTEAQALELQELKGASNTAAVHRAQVFLNGTQLPIKSFKDYVQLYLEDKEAPRVHEKINDRWEVVVTATQGQFQQASKSCQLFCSKQNNESGSKKTTGRTIMPSDIC